jgi:hypothetical protein
MTDIQGHFGVLFYARNSVKLHIFVRINIYKEVNAMKVKPLIKQLNQALAVGNEPKARKIYTKLMHKSLKHKRTQAVR